jgi:hypothetical protein
MMDERPSIISHILKRGAIMKIKSLLIGVLILSWVMPIAFAQEKQDETQYAVPELDAFHDIIYPIWHTAYPLKDMAALKGFVPEVDRMAKAILEAKLPGILKDREDKWNTGLAAFKKTVEDYARAAAAGSDQALLAAAEALHSGYEMLVRIVRPVPPEVMDFHRSLYVLYHTYLPNKDHSQIRAVASVLLIKAETLAKAVLSKRFESRKDKFQAAAGELLEAVKALTAVPDGSDAGLAPAVEKVHSRYQNLEKVFD